MAATGTVPVADGPRFVAEARQRVEDALRAAVKTDDPFLTEVASHLIVAGGKRVRPLFAVAAASADSPNVGAIPEAAILGGVAVELVHLGSLYHDDVIDEAEIRRQVDTVNARWGNLTAILSGDYLLAKASEIAASLGTEVAGLLARTIGWLCEGEVAELRSAFDVTRTEQAYLDSIKGKTASLFATACRIGGIVGDLPREHIDALTTFGEGYGMAFQIVDDVLDLVATEEELGKPAGHDLVEGVYTLPVLRALAASGGDELRARLGSPLEGTQLDDALELVRSNGAVPAAIDAARGFVDEAVSALAPFGTNESTTWLSNAAQRLLDGVTAAATR